MATLVFDDLPKELLKQLEQHSLQTLEPPHAGHCSSAPGSIAERLTSAQVVVSRGKASNGPMRAVTLLP
jgi:hypothetical protein